MPADTRASPDDLVAVRSLREGLVSFPETVFLMGYSLDLVDPQLRDLDARMRLGIGSVLDATPPVWVYTEPFAIGKRMVTNAEYAEFLRYEDEQGSFYDSAEVWRHVYAEQGFHINTMKSSFKGADGAVRQLEEDYSSCESFVEAYIQSLYYEAQHTLAGLGPDAEAGHAPATGEPVGMDLPIGEVVAARFPSLDSAFAFVRHKLRDLLGAEDAEDENPLSTREQHLLAEYESVDQALADMDAVILDLKKGYARHLDPRFRQAFDRDRLVLETVTFLTRLKAAVRADPVMESTVPLHKVLYPRWWKSNKGQSQRRRLKSAAVAWGKLPVVGVSFFEALAYVTWLSSVADIELGLPNEAQYERASSWPQESHLPAEGLEGLDAGRKLLFPWQDRCPDDSRHFFGRDGFGLEAYYHKHANDYETLVESTARRISDTEIIEQLEGFGWHWTLDRYSESERKYSRFEDREYPVWRHAPCPGAGNDAPVTVYRYVPNRNPSDSFIVLKGSPDIIAGPGVTTRRYASNPLRGYASVGFRLVRQDGQGS